MARAVRIGIDFDNTIVTYDHVFLTAARARGLVPSGFSGGKKAVRDRIRLLPDGELCWQKLQGYVYGAGIRAATMIDGVEGFLERCRAEGAEVMIVSHKTEYGHFDPMRVNLRTAALEWMQAQGLFEGSRYGLSPDGVFFEGTRADKLARIASLSCTHFVDDLAEVMDDPQFPPGVARILFAQAEERNSSAPPYAVCSSWQAIEAEVFDERA